MKLNKSISRIMINGKPLNKFGRCHKLDLYLLTEWISKIWSMFGLGTKWWIEMEREKMLANACLPSLNCNRYYFTLNFLANVSINKITSIRYLAHIHTQASSKYVDVISDLFIDRWKILQLRFLRSASSEFSWFSVGCLLFLWLHIFFSSLFCLVRFRFSFYLQ